MDATSLLWTDATLVAFDLETSGAYPLDSEICEIAAVKWQGGKVVDEFQTLVRPIRPMTDFIIGIHGITNEMVMDAPRIDAVIEKFHSFIGDGFLLAHHAPFDIGFLAVDFEKAGLAFPENAVICTSLLARNLYPKELYSDLKDHKLQTLAAWLKIDSGKAHRALSDSRTCLELGLRCMKKVGSDATVDEIIKSTGKKLLWKDYSINELRAKAELAELISAIEDRRDVELNYANSESWRRVHPIGVVRNPEGDYAVIETPGDIHKKRFYLNKVKGSRPLR